MLRILFVLAMGVQHGRCLTNIKPLAVLMLKGAFFVKAVLLAGQRIGGNKFNPALCVAHVACCRIENIKALPCGLLCPFFGFNGIKAFQGLAAHGVLDIFNISPSIGGVARAH